MPLLRRTALLALALGLAAPAEAQVNDSLLVLFNRLEARIMFETVVDPGGLNEAEVVWTAPAGAPAARSITFGQGRRLTEPVDLRAASLDTLWRGSGLVPTPGRIRALQVELDTGTLTVRAPRAGWEEGVAAARAVFEPNDATTVRAEARVWTDMRPGEARFVIGMPPALRDAVLARPD